MSGLLEQAKEIRTLAERARRLASGMNAADCQCLLLHAKDLERQAAELERQFGTQPTKFDSVSGIVHR